MIRFFVAGVPIPQGSKMCKCLGNRAVMWEANSKLKVWREKVTAEAIQYIRQNNIEMLDEPIAVAVNFMMPKPKTVNRDLPTVKPDVDKLVRAVLDGLTKAKMYKDDAQVVFLEANKFYAEDETGCWIVVNGVSNV